MMGETAIQVWRPQTDNIYCMDALQFLRQMPSGGVHCIVTSPPYFGLRSYLPDGHPDKPLENGLEPTMQAFITRLVELFREARRVLRDDGLLWLNLGDSYNSSSQNNHGKGGALEHKVLAPKQGWAGHRPMVVDLRPKNLIGIPWRVAFALQADGWILRSDIIWHKCLSGGTWVYTQTQKGEMPMMIRDAARLNPSTVKLWNGEKWTQVTGWQRLPRKGTELELVLRSGERISCTPEHRFPTERGLVSAADLIIGDVLCTSNLPEPENIYNPVIINNEAAWFVGLYLAEGSRSDDMIQIAGHSKEVERIPRLQALADYYGGSLTYTVKGNNLNIRMYGRFLLALIEQYVSGNNARDKGLKVRVWSHSNEWLAALLHGYLAGDGHWDSDNQRWRLGFTRNYNLERDLRTLAARLGIKLKLVLSHAQNQDGRFPAFRGELRFTQSGHHNEKSMSEIVAIRKARCREVYDVSVADEPHLFALASGVLTHNSNPMPESVTDRCTKAHEYIFMFAKSERYFYDQQAIMEPAQEWGERDRSNGKYTSGDVPISGGKHHGLKGRPRPFGDKGNQDRRDIGAWYEPRALRNRRSVWSISTEPTREAHFATFPTALITPMILAGCPASGVVLDPFMGSGTTALVAKRLGRHYIGCDLNPEYVRLAQWRLSTDFGKPKVFEQPTADYSSLPIFQVAE